MSDNPFKSDNPFARIDNPEFDANPFGDPSVTAAADGGAGAAASAAPAAGNPFAASPPPAAPAVPKVEPVPAIAPPIVEPPPPAPSTSTSGSGGAGVGATVAAAAGGLAAGARGAVSAVGNVFGGGGSGGGGSSSGAAGKAPAAPVFGGAFGAGGGDGNAAGFGATSSGAGGSAYGSASDGAAGSDALRAKEAELRRLEERLETRERELKARAEELKRAGAGLNANNFPPCMPILYHNIEDEIPANVQSVVLSSYYCYLGLAACLSWNFFATTCSITVPDIDDRFSAWLFSALYIGFGMPLAFMLWHFRLYHAAKNDAAFKYFTFFFFFFVHIVFCFWACISPPFFGGKGWSLTGIIPTSTAFGKASWLGVIYAIGTALWSLEAIYSMYTIKQVYAHFRGSGAQDRAVREGAQYAARAAV